jgi:type I restriction enzyme M protein
MAKIGNGNGIAELERRLWAAADQLWANSPLRPSEYSAPVLGLIFLRFADNTFTKVEAELKGKATGRRTIGKLDYQARNVMFLPNEARFSRLLDAPEGADTGKLLNEAMKAVERENEDLKDVLPKTYQGIDNTVLVELLKIMSGIPLDIPGDTFGKIYEYFLGAFAMKRQQSRGMVRLCIEEFLDKLPQVYATDLYRAKCEAVYQHVFDSYGGSGENARPQAAVSERA